MKTKNTDINYYGTDIDVIHLKFGHARKLYHFTAEFERAYPKFCEEYRKYWDGDSMSKFTNAYTIIKYIADFNIPVHLYFNYTDEPTDTKGALEWWLANNMVNKPLEE